MLHMIGNAHIDPVWLWRWTDGCAEAISTCWSAIDRLEESQDFVFTRGEAQVYAWIEELDPPLFARIQHFVAEGRWVVVNGWWIQPDCNLPSGEAIIRQALYGKRYFKQKFGIDVPVGYNVDSFGHAETFPMLLRHTRSDSYVFMRPGPHEMTLPANLFDWQSPDGSSVPTFRIQTAYLTNTRWPLASKIPEHLAMQDHDGHPYMLFYGVGNHGGGPTRENIAAIDAAREAGTDLGFSDPNHYFKAIADLPKPTVDTELQFHAIGCYAVAGELKALNRRAEARLGMAETAATLAFREAGAPYPRAKLEALWQKLLFNQFHDTLGGTSIESACVDSVHEWGEVLAGAETILNASVRRLSAIVKPASERTAASVQIMNFNAETYDGLCEVEPWTNFDTSLPRLLLDEEGNAIPFQFVSPESKKDGMQRIAFRVTVPGYGRRLLSFADRAEGQLAPSVNAGRPLTPGAHTVETGGWKLTLDARTGAIAQLVNKASGISVLTAPGHLGIVVDDATDTWSHGVDRFGFEGETARLVGLNLLEDGPLRKSIEVIVSFGASRMTTALMVPEAADLPVELRVSLDWQEKHKLLRLAYPLSGKHFEYEVPAGWTERPDDGKEVFGHSWVRIAREDCDVVLANDAKYSYAAEDGTLYITATRSPVYAHHDPVKLEDGAVYRYLDQGEQSFTLRIGAAKRIGRKTAMRMATELLRPLILTPHVSRGGTAAQAGSWLETSSVSSAILALKLAEDSDATVLRAVEFEGNDDVLNVGGKRLAIPARAIASGMLTANALTECDGLEDL